MLMFLIGSINFIVDPGEIYLKKILADNKTSEFSKKLLSSKNGVVQSGWNERLIKTTLAKKSGDFDCVILGSSRVKQISSIRNTGNIKNKCEKILNLGVSGGSLEDLSIFSYLIFNNINRPKKVFIGIDPWTFKFGVDSRYAQNENIYIQMNELLNENENNESISYIKKLAGNLFNGEYFQASLKDLFDDKKSIIGDIFKKNIVFPEDGFSYKSGYKQEVTLPDGSHVYAKNWILKQKDKKVILGGPRSHWGIFGQIYDNKALDYLQEIVVLYDKNEIELSLILTPYHPNVFKNGNTQPVKYYKSIENIVKTFGDENKLKVYGSFFPDIFGCKSEEFFDYMHPTIECLNRIDFSK
ncbi:MAG: hypothetical protein ACI9LM_004138 [Alteromonadaceae bacterium]|jgi:hypothetical protein